MSPTLDCGLAATTQSCQDCGTESGCGWRCNDRLRRFGYFGHCLMHFLCSLRTSQISLGKNADAAPLLINYRDAANLMCLHQPLAGIQALLRPTGHRVARDISFDACGLRIQFIEPNVRYLTTCGVVLAPLNRFGRIAEVA